MPWLVPYAAYLFDTAAGAGLRPRVTSVFRTRQDQARLWDRYQRGLSRLPAAPPGRSKHERGLAFDMTVQPPELAAAVGRLWQQMGGRWGGQRDPVHFEAPG
ncbi:MAG: D-alanyl-D-alanine carboxypeptidase family protein [candidate division NC10 bacterium]|nr:D-alanyl-D-alanine carboxypeptidase family protein [candidate division NC10 bacterium]